MIFVTLGTQDKPFNRLLEVLEKEILDGKIKERVVVQAGCTNYKSDVMEVFDLISLDKFEEMMNNCDLLITHGGVGSVISGLSKGKKVIAVARLARYGEHVNDHQLQIVENFNEQGYIIGLSDVNSLSEALTKVKSFEPKKYKSNTDKMIKLVEELIEKA